MENENDNFNIDDEFDNHALIKQHENEIKCKLMVNKRPKNALIEFNIDFILIKTYYNAEVTLIPYDKIDYVLYAYTNNKISGIQIFIKSSEKYFILINEDLLQEAVHLLKSIPVKVQDKDAKEFIKISDLTNKWLKGKITNFEYLMSLNILSGRNYNDQSNYPIFPWVLRDFESSVLDLNDNSIYINFSLPNDEKLTHILSKHFQNNEHLYDFWNTNPLYSYYNLAHLILKDSNEDYKLPPWSNNSKIEFIYRHCKALESDYVSSHLNEWIDFIFGYKQGENNRNNVFNSELYKTMIFPLKLFDKPHPKKKVSTSPKLLFRKTIVNKYSIIKFNEISDICAFHVTLNNQDKKILFTLLDNKNNIFIYKSDVPDTNNQKIVLKNKTIQNIHKCDYSLGIFNKIPDDFKPEFPTFISQNLFLFVYDSSKAVFYSIKKREIVKIHSHKASIISINSNNDEWIVISSNDCIVNVYDIFNMENEQSDSKYHKNYFNNFGPSFSFNDKVRLISINPKFNALICGTESDLLYFCRFSSSDFEVIRTIDFKVKIKNIIITGYFGFVVVFTEHVVNDMNSFEQIDLFTINGEKIKSSKLDNNMHITAITKASLLPGSFDFLIVADNLNYIYMFDAFDLVFDQPIFKCSSRVLKLFYIQSESLIIAFCEDNTSVVISYPIK